MIKATIHFTTNTGRITTVTKEFNGQRHIDNFVTYATTYWNNITGLDKIEYEKS
tara:strand:- start:2631 stop:2792 length:162 start_codon:yes stop_codon:yes gene_type:complete